jgi:hypothetical protein
MEKSEEPDAPSTMQPDVAELAREVVKHLRAQRAKASEPAAVTVSMEVLTKCLIELATNAWRIRTKLQDPMTHEPREELSKDETRKTHRFLDAIFASLEEIGLQVKDRTGEAFDYGLPEKVITTQPQAGLTRELIIETIRPTIYWNAQIAQQGEVVVATPENIK